MQHKSKMSSCAENVLFFKRKEKKRTTETAWPRIPSHIANTAAARASSFFYSCSARSRPFVPLPSKLLSFFTNKIKIKKMQHYSKRSSFAEKALFRKKKKKKKETWRPRPHIPSHIATALQPALFSAAAAREAALRAASRFSALLAAASRFCCSIHGNCSASHTKSQILQPCDPGLSFERS